MPCGSRAQEAIRKPSSGPSQSRQLQCRAAGLAREDRGQQMRRAGGIDHPAARRALEGPGQRAANPVRAVHPSPVLRARGRAEPGLHRQQMTHGDLVKAGVRVGRQVIRQQRRDALIRALQHAAVDGDADQGRHDRFRRGHDRRRGRGAVPAIAALGDKGAAMRDHDGFERREGLRLIQKRRDGAGRVDGPRRNGLHEQAEAQHRCDEHVEGKTHGFSFARRSGKVRTGPCCTAGCGFEMGRAGTRDNPADVRRRP